MEHYKVLSVVGEWGEGGVASEASFRKYTLGYDLGKSQTHPSFDLRPSCVPKNSRA
jgi:hypothetical protein